MLFFNKIFKREKYNPDEIKLPTHIAIIMDGNGRWAKKKGLPRNVGHREGANTLKKIVGYCDKIGLKYLTVYAFSTENWKRPKSEVDTLMSLLVEFLRNAERDLAGKTVRIKFIGDIAGLSKELHEEIERVTKVSRNNTGLTLNIALNYGSRDEILHAVKGIINEAVKGHINVSDVNTQMISENLYTYGTPDPDLLIRTSGEKRISNFLLWQAAYTEFWYTDIFWPDFREKHLMEAIKDYQNRNRRYGGI